MRALVCDSVASRYLRPYRRYSPFSVTANTCVGAPHRMASKVRLPTFDPDSKTTPDSAPVSAASRAVTNTDTSACGASAPMHNSTRAVAFFHPADTNLFSSGSLRELVGECGEGLVDDLARIRIHPTPQPPRRIIQRRLQDQEPVINRPHLLGCTQPCLAGRLPMQPRHIPLQPQTHISRNPGQRLDPPERSSSGERLPKIRTIGGATHQPDQTTGIFQGGVQHQPHPLPQSPAPIPGVDLTPVQLLEQFELAGPDL